MNFNFKDWLAENKQNIHFDVFSSDGIVGVTVNGKKYVFRTDTAYHRRWQRMIPYQPFTVLNDINLQVKNGHAELVEPKEKEKETPTPQVQPKQKKLF